MRLPTPKAGFRIKPSRHSRLGVIVLVFRTVKDMRRWVWITQRRNRTSVRTKGLMACCLGAVRRRSNDFCVVCIPERYLRMNTITHEMFHATCRWYERVGGRSMAVNDHAHQNMRPGHRKDSAEERCATVHGRLCRALVIKAQALGLDI